MSRPTLLPFDESTRAEKLPLEVFKWLNEATNYTRSSTSGIDDVYNALKLVLRLVAVRNPNSQSHAMRKALGLLIESICQHDDCEKICLDLLGLLIRMVDAKQDQKYNPMKFLAISGLGYLSPYLKSHMRQMSVNVFIICVDSLKICNPTPDTLLYRNCILWSMRQSATASVDELHIKTAAKCCLAMIENANKRDPVGIQTLTLAFDLLALIMTFPSAKYLEKKLDHLHQIFLNHGCIHFDEQVRKSSAQFYSAALLHFNSQSFRQSCQAVVQTILKTQSHSNWGKSTELSAKLDGHVILLSELIKSQANSADFESQMEEWLAPMLLQLTPNLAVKFIVDVVAKKKIVGGFAGIDLVGVLLRQLALARVPAPVPKSTKSKKSQNAKPLVESTFACLSSTVLLLGHSAQSVASAIHQAALGYLFNSNSALTDAQRVWVVTCLESVVKSTPTLLITTIEMCLKQLEVTSSQSDGSRLTDLTYVLGSMVALSTNLRLYSDDRLVKRIMLMSIELIQKGADVESYNAGWHLMAGILSLGPQVVKPLVAQLLLLWESHLLKIDQVFMESCLTGLMIFLFHNKPLLTPDVTVRIGDLLNDLWSILEQQPTNVYVRRRFLQCFDELLNCKRINSHPSSLLMKFIAYVTNSNSYSKESNLAIESAMVLTKAKRKVEKEHSINEIQLETLWEPINAIESGLSSLEVTGLNHCASNDVDYSISFQEKENYVVPEDVYTTNVNLAISVCSKLLPLQPLKIKESVFDAILTQLESSIKVSSLRKGAVVYNIATLMSRVLGKEIDSEERLVKVILSILKLLLGSPFLKARQLAAESLGVCLEKLKHSHYGSSMLASLAKELLENAATNNVSLNLRSGSIIALGYIVGERPQTALIDATFKLLMPLAAHPEPQIHVPVLEAMQRILTSSELLDQKYVKYTLKALITTYLLESHSKFISFQIQVAKTLVHIISRFGPTLSSDKSLSNRQVIICLADQLQCSDHPAVRVFAFKACIELYYYARKGILWQLFIRRWKEIICNPDSLSEEVDAAISGLLILVRLSAKSIFSVAGPGLDVALWILLDKKPESAEIKSIFKSLLSQTMGNDLAIMQWIQSLSEVITKPRYFFANRLARIIGIPNNNAGGYSNTPKENLAAVTVTAIAADEEVTLGIISEESANDQLSWQCRQFALELLLDLLRLDLQGKDDSSKAVSIAAKSIGDLIKLSFSCSTSQVLELQLSGLKLLSEVVEQLGCLADPDFSHISLLEQYQVQIISAICPAFGPDSSPDVALAALQTCSSFLTFSVVKGKEKFKRLTKILEGSLESCSSSSFKLGQLEMSGNAQDVLKVALLALWADLMISNNEHLLTLIDPHEKELFKQWKDAVFAYGHMNAGIESQWTASSTEIALDQMTEIQHGLLIRPVLKSSWLKFIRALVLSLKRQNLDDTQNSRLLLVMSSLCYQAATLCLQHSTPGYGDGHIDPNDETVRYRRDVLETLSTILTPNTCRLVIESTDNYFQNIIPLLYRSMLVGQAEEQMYVLKIARNLVSSQTDTDESVNYMFDLLKTVLLPLRHLLPQLIDPNVHLHQPCAVVKLDIDQVHLLRNTMNTIIDIAQHFRDVIQNDLWVCLLQAFEELNHQQPEVAAPSFKLLLEILAHQVDERGVTFIVGALTVALKRAVETSAILEGLLVSTAILCTNWRSLCSKSSLKFVFQFGLRASDALSDSSHALTSLQCINAVFRVCSGSPTGHAFAYGCLPGLAKLVGENDPEKKALVEHAAKSLTIYGATDGSQEVLSLVVPTLLNLSSTDQAMARGLLSQIVTKQPETFKATVWRMHSDDRAILQQLFTQDPAEVAEEAEDSGEDEGQIVLTSFV